MLSRHPHIINVVDLSADEIFVHSPYPSQGELPLWKTKSSSRFNRSSFTKLVFPILQRRVDHLLFPYIEALYCFYPESISACVILAFLHSPFYCCPRMPGSAMLCALIPRQAYTHRLHH